MKKKLLTQVWSAMRSLKSISFILFIAVTLFMQSCVTVIPGQVVLLQKRGVLLPNSYLQGRHYFNPFGMTVLRFSTRVMENSSKLELPTKEGLEVTSDITLLYHLAPDSVKAVFKNFGMNYNKVLVLNTYLTEARQASLSYNASELITERESLEKTIKEKMTEGISKYGFVVDAVMIKDIDLPDEVMNIIKNKVKTEQTSKQFAVDMEIKTKQLEFDLDKQRKEASFDIEKRKQEQEYSIENQRKELDFAIEKQKKESERLLIDAEAQKKAALLMNETITDKTIKLRTLDASKEWAKSENTKLIITDGKTPIFMGGGLVNMDTTQKTGH